MIQLCAGMLGLTVVCGVIARVEWGLILLVFITYSRFSDVLIHNHHAPSIAQPLAFLIAFVILFRSYLSGKRPVGWERTGIFLAMYGLIGLASLLFAADFSRALAALSTFAKDALIVFLVVILLQRAVMLRRVIWALLGAGLFMGTITAYQYLSGTFDHDYWGFGQAAVHHLVETTNDYRVSGPLGNANAYGQILIVLVPLALDRLWREKAPLLRLLAAWTLTVCSLSIIFTFSRGAFVGLVVALGLFLIRYSRRSVTLALTGVLILPLLLALPAPYTDRLKTLVDALPIFGHSSKHDTSMRGRMSENIVGWQMFNDHLLLGVGLDNFRAHYRRYAHRVGLDLRHEDRGAHNLYLQIAAETGLVGLTVFGALLWFMFRGMNRAREDLISANMHDTAELVIALRIGLTGYLVHGLVIHAAYPRFFWLLIGIAFALPQLGQNELIAQQQASESPLDDGQPPTTVATPWRKDYAS